MKTQRYRLRLTGLHEAEGQIRAASLVEVLKALVEAARSATNLLAVGEGRSRSGQPQWLKESVDLVLTGLEPRLHRTADRGALSRGDGTRAVRAAGSLAGAP